MDQIGLTHQKIEVESFANSHITHQSQSHTLIKHISTQLSKQPSKKCPVADILSDSTIDSTINSTIDSTIDSAVDIPKKPKRILKKISKRKSRHGNGNIRAEGVEGADRILSASLIDIPSNDKPSRDAKSLKKIRIKSSNRSSNKLSHRLSHSSPNDVLTHITHTSSDNARSSPIIGSTESSHDDNTIDVAYRVIYENLKVLRKIKVNDKLCVSAKGELSIDTSYIPSLTRTLTGNNKMKTLERIDETIKMAKLIRRKVKPIRDLMDKPLAIGIRNLAETYAGSDKIRSTLEVIAGNI
jgi:hypothetical protein